MLAILFVQTLLMALYAIFVTYRVMGKIKMLRFLRRAIAV